MGEATHLESVLPKLKAGGLRARMLVRDAIELSRADGKYAQEEKAAVAKAAQLLGVDETTVKPAPPSRRGGGERGS